MSFNTESNMIKTNENITEFNEIIKDISENSIVLDLKQYIQHISSSRYSHCIEVAYFTFIICKKLGLDYISAARGAMLHDLYFYDWSDKNIESSKFLHLFKHPRIALNNAVTIFDLNDLEKDVIIKHMWPITVKLPKFSETYIVTFVDKYCATVEFFRFLRYHKMYKEGKNKI